MLQRSCRKKILVGSLSISMKYIDIYFRAMCLKKSFGEVEGNQIVESLEAIRE